MEECTFFLSWCQSLLQYEERLELSSHQFDGSMLVLILWEQMKTREQIMDYTVVQWATGVKRRWSGLHECNWDSV